MTETAPDALAGGDARPFCEPGRAPARKSSRLVTLGVTGDWAFAAGTLLLALRRHNPDLGADILVFHDDGLRPSDRALLEGLGARCEPFAVACDGLRPEAVRLLSPLSLAKFACFRLLADYESVLWLDTDLVVQDDLGDVFSHGPLALAVEDPEFTGEGRTCGAAVNFYEPVPGVDGDAPNLNTGVMVWRRGLCDPEALERRCLDFLQAHGPKLRYPDQAALNALAQWMRIERPGELAELPRRFNCHPRNPAAVYAPVVHAFGAYKLWNDGLTAACFPEWQRDYARWLRLGGSPYAGPVDNAAYGEGGAFYLLRGLFDTIGKSEQALNSLRERLAAESAARKKLEDLLRRLQPRT